MARKPHVISNPQREARMQVHRAAPLVGNYGIDEINVALHFVDPEGKQHPSPRATTYTSDMHAYFHFTCPMRDCTDGGFEAHADLLSALSEHRDGHTGTLVCEGVRPRGGLKGARCNIELRYTPFRECGGGKSLEYFVSLDRSRYRAATWPCEPYVRPHRGQWYGVSRPILSQSSVAICE